MSAAASSWPCLRSMRRTRSRIWVTRRSTSESLSGSSGWNSARLWIEGHSKVPSGQRVWKWGLSRRAWSKRWQRTTVAVRGVDAAGDGAAFEEGADGADQDAADAGAELGVVGAEEADAVGEGDDPLADGNFGKHAVDEPCGGVDHAAGAAGGAEAAAFAGEGDESVSVTLRAVDAGEAVLEDAAAEVCAEFVGDEGGEASAGGVVVDVG